MATVFAAKNNNLIYRNRIC